MLKKLKTPQEILWSGQFGDDYTLRNQSTSQLTSSLSLYSQILSRTEQIQSVIEFGANIGINIRAIKLLLPKCKISALEINKQAAADLKKIPDVKVYTQSIFNFKPNFQRDFVFTRGFLIHLNPELLPKAYEILYRTTKKYLCVAEYYNPTPVEIPYRGQQHALFKRDFAGEIVKLFPRLQLVDYGFVYHGDTHFPQDDITWFLMKIS